MPIEGPLSELGIQDVLQLLDLTRKTGVLTVHSAKMHDEATVLFERGVIVSARRRRSLRRIGQQLLRAGKLTERELERALEVQRQTRERSIGEILLELGSVSEEELDRQLRFQFEETIYDLMGWDEGEFRFEERESVPVDHFAVRVKVESLLMEGARRIDEWSRLGPRIPSLESVPQLSDTDEAEGVTLDLRPDEWEVLAEVDGERDIRQIAADLGRSTFDVSKIIYGLVTTGVVTVEEPRARRPRQDVQPVLDELRLRLAAGQYDEAARLSGEAQRAYPEDARIALLNGQALAGQGRLRAATEAFARAVALDPLLPEGQLRLGFAAARVGEFARAVQAWTNYLRLSEQDEAAAEQRQRVARALEVVHALRELIEDRVTANA